MKERVILADCCEHWIIEWGGFYKSDRAFSCPECATEWKKTDTETYRRGDGRIFTRRTRVGPQASFPYLGAADGHHPNVERCCAKFCCRTVSGCRTDPSCVRCAGRSGSAAPSGF